MLFNIVNTVNNTVNNTGTNLNEDPQKFERYHQLHPVQAREEASVSGMLERPPEKNIENDLMKIYIW